MHPVQEVKPNNAQPSGLSKPAWQDGEASPTFLATRGLRLLALLAAGLSAGYVVLFLILASLRAVYPYELEWIEGAHLDEILWIMQGNPLYGEPSIAFIPFAYNPVYFILSAALMEITGVGFLAPRLISILATLGCFALLYKLAAEGQPAAKVQPLAGVIAAGIYAASFRFAGAWMDITKTDSLFLFFILAGFFTARKYTGRWGALASALLYVLAYYTKQLALPVILGLAAVSLVESKGRTWLLWLATLLLGAAVFLSLELASQGWFSYYSLRMLSYHALSSDLWYFWVALFKQMWPAMAAGLLYPVLGAAGWKTSGRPAYFWQNLALAGALVLASWSIFLKVWTYDNGFMPACAGLALLAGLGVGQAMDLARRSQWSRGPTVLYAAGLVAIILQLGSLYYDPRQQLPTQADRQAAEAFVEQVRSLPGEVLVFSHGYFNYLAGKNTYFSSVAYGDVAGAALPPRSVNDRIRSDKVRQAVKQGFQDQVYDWMITDKPADSSHLPYYVYVEPIFGQPDVMYPVTGARSRPESLLRRNPVAKGGAFPLQDPQFASLFGEGWEAPQDWGRPVSADQASLLVPLEAGHAYTMRVEARPICAEGTPAVQAAHVTWNTLLLGEMVFTSCEPHIHVFEIPAIAIEPEMNSLRFDFVQPQTPQGQSYVEFGALVFVQD